MKHMKKFNEYINENINPSLDDLSKFAKDFRSGNTPFQKQYSNYKIDTDKIKEMVSNLVMTDEFKSELTKRSVTIPDVSKLKFFIDKTQYHRIFNYELSDVKKIDEDNEKFNILIKIEVPFDESFEDDNTLISCGIYVKNRGKYKALYGYGNKRATKDNEFNYYSVGSVLQMAYEDVFKK